MNKEETILSNIDAIKDSFYNDILDIPTKEDILNQVQCCIIYLQEEKERLNNIIEDLEKWIKEDKEYAINNFECGRCFNMYDILNKLKELKEGKDVKDDIAS